ncbi:MAG: glycerophosphodiester phosphodiesterase [Chloroflexi bacterium]|nr:glycerophosphodiester phosphodiesterase [Chloroflexota bacterium]
MPPPLVISHRTNMGTMPENTLAGVDAALADGVDGVEIDVRATADGHVVLLHDAALERTAGDPREVSSLTLADLTAVRVRPVHGHPRPEPVPTLSETLARIGGRCTLVIEVKQEGIEAAVARDVRAAGAAGWCWIWAFDPAVGAACRRVLPEVPVALNSGPDSPERYGYASAIEAAAAARFAAVSFARDLVDPATVAAAHGRGLRVYTWTVDDPEEIARVVEAGVDAVCGNFPPRIRAVLAQRAAG